MLQLERYGLTDGRPCKNTTPIPIQPGEPVVLPVFDNGHDTELSHLTFRVAYVIYHHGTTTNSGHYQLALCHTKGGASRVQWQFYVCNDNCLPRSARPSDLRDIQGSGYLVGLVRDVVA